MFSFSGDVLVTTVYCLSVRINIDEHYDPRMVSPIRDVKNQSSLSHENYREWKTPTKSKNKSPIYIEDEVNFESRQDESLSPEGSIRILNPEQERKSISGEELINYTKKHNKSFDATLIIDRISNAREKRVFVELNLIE